MFRASHLVFNLVGLGLTDFLPRSDWTRLGELDENKLNISEMNLPGRDWAHLGEIL